MEKEFVPFKLAVKLKELGFNSSSGYSYMKFNCDGVSNATIERVVPDHLYNFHYLICEAPLWQQAFDYIEDKFGLSGEVQKQASFDKAPVYWFYMITDDKGNDLSDMQGRFSNILQKSHQDVVGYFVNEELFNKYLFEDDFAFSSRQSAKEACLKELIKIIEKLK